MAALRQVKLNCKSQRRDRQQHRSAQKRQHRRSRSRAARTGPRYGYARIGPKGSDSRKASTLTYDIVAFWNTGWCGIAVRDETPCGAIGLRIAPFPRRIATTPSPANWNSQRALRPMSSRRGMRRRTLKLGERAYQPAIEPDRRHGHGAFNDAPFFSTAGRIGAHRRRPMHP